MNKWGKMLQTQKLKVRHAFVFMLIHLNHITTVFLFSSLVALLMQIMKVRLNYITYILLLLCNSFHCSSAGVFRVPLLEDQPGFSL